MFGTDLEKFILHTHIATALVGGCVFALSLYASFFYMRMYHQLKNKRIQKSTPKFNLARWESLLVYSSFLGLVAISISLASGLVLVSVVKAPLEASASKMIWAFFVWGWYMVALIGRKMWGWRAKKGATLVSVGTFILLAGIFLFL